MSVADRVAQTDLASSSRVLQQALDGPSGPRPLRRDISLIGDDPDVADWGLISQVEIYLRAIAIIEVSLQLGLKNPLSGEDISFAKKFLANESVSNYCNANRLLLPSVFLTRLTASRDYAGLKLSSDRAIRSRVERIDPEKLQQSVISAFHDLIAVGVYSLGKNSFLRGVRTNLFGEAAVLETLRDQEHFQEILGLAAGIESDGEPAVRSLFRGQREKPEGVPDNLSNASVLVAYSRFQLLMTDMDSALKTIKEYSANWNSVQELIRGHIIPDSGRIADRVSEVAHAVTAGMAQAFRLRRKRFWRSSGEQTGEAMTEYVMTYSPKEYLEYSASFADDDGEEDAFYPLAETFAFDGSQIVLRFSRESASCVRILRRFDWNVFNLRVAKVDDAAFLARVSRRAIFLTQF